MSYQLSGNALIIGGTSGIGLETAMKLANQKIPVTILGNNTEKLNHAVNKIQEVGNVKAIQLNLYNANDVNSLVEKIKASTKPIGYLVNAAGYFNPKAFIEHSVEDWCTIGVF